MCFPDKKLIPDRATSGSNISLIAENPHYQHRNHRIVLYVRLYIYIYTNNLTKVPQSQPFV